MANVAKNENKPSFLEGVKAEWNKISWPGKDMLTKQTVAVIIVTILLGVLIAVLDTGLQYGINLLSL